MKGDLKIRLMVVGLLAAMLLGGVRTAQAVAPGTYTDSLAVKVDSAVVDGDYLLFSLMMYRTNRSWVGSISSVQDTMLGNADFYFTYNKAVVDNSVVPSMIRQHANMDPSTSGTNLLYWTARYYAGRFNVKVMTKPGATSLLATLGLPYSQDGKGAIELCRVKVKMVNAQMNPGINWDVKATGAQSAIGEPIILSLLGDLDTNPNKDIILQENSHTVWACEDGTADFYAKGFTTGTKMKVAWYMSDQKDCKAAYEADPVNNAKFESAFEGMNATSQMHMDGKVTGTRWGDVDFSIVSGNDGQYRVDTLRLKKAVKGMDKAYLQCEISDALLTAQAKLSSNDPTGGEDAVTQLRIRDKVYAWVAASDPSRRTGAVGASDVTDTVLRCPKTGEWVTLYFYGPKCNEDAQMIGAWMDVDLAVTDPLGVPRDETVRVSGWSLTGEAAPNGSQCLWTASIQLEKNLKASDLRESTVWVKGLTTEKGCEGEGYHLYDTIAVRDLMPDETLSATLAPFSVHAGDTKTLVTSYTPDGGTALTLTPDLKKPNLPGSRITNGIYYAPTTPCSDAAGCHDTIVYTYDEPLGGGNSCPMEITQPVTIGDEYFLSMKVLLEGGLRSGAILGEMGAYLKDDFPKDGNFFVSPYTGEKLVSKLPNVSALNAGDIVDWVFIRLRDASNVGSVMETVDSVSAFVLQDGTVCDVEGNPYVKFQNLPKTNYHVVVEHRNHIGVMSKNEVVLKNSAAAVSTTSIDFTNISNVYSVSSSGLMYAVGNGGYALYAGDVNGDDVISSADVSDVDLKNGEVGYTTCDLSFDVVVSSYDKFFPGNNSGVFAQYLQTF